METNINWGKYFDKIICIHYVNHPERLNRLLSELDRVGILKSGIFQYEIGYDSPFFDILQKNIKFRSTEKLICLPQFKGAFKCCLSHYNIMKLQQCFGWKRILILEDDIVFLKNLEEINNILNNIPDYDVCLFDKFTNPGHRTDYINILNNNSLKINNYFSKFDDSIEFWSSACYAITLKTSYSITALNEQEFTSSDGCWNHSKERGIEINKIFAIKNLGRQKSFPIHNYQCFDTDAAYESVKLDPTEYQY